MSSNVEHVHFKEEINPKVMLRQLADDEDLEACVAVVLNNNGTTECYCSVMTVRDLSHCGMLQQHAALKEMQKNQEFD